MITSNEIREKFLAYFAEHGHETVPSASLIPINDPTLLFVNAGMVPFKDVFLGVDKRPYSRATSSQRCVRAGGKHNDLDQVGYTARHHTFFEMLGNFSFGDYFKREAIRYAWDFLTQQLGLPEEKLWVTVYEDDDEAADIWLKEMGVSSERFSRCGAEDNFWSMGDTGPCGPCSEIFYDHGADIPGGPPGSPEQDGDRYIEIWNLVFMQYDRAASGEMTPLPKPSVDTGMGLERLSAVLQGVHNNYDTDLFTPILQKIAKLTGNNDTTHTSMRVIADHIRSTAFLIADGIVPSNEGRGYVLRRIIRRAVRHGHKLGLEDSFFYKLVAALIEKMGQAYPELVSGQQHIEHIIRQEEEQFATTLSQGLKILEQDIAKLTDNVIPGATIFRLYDTYGFPPDLTGDIARERQLTLDLEGFQSEMEKQRSQSKQASRFAADYSAAVQLDHDTEFTGYEHLQHEAKVIVLLRDGQQVEALAEGESGIVVLNQTPFYAESGGQVGDQGQLIWQDGVFEVNDTQRQGKANGHMGKLTQGQLKIGDSVHAHVDLSLRQATALNHSATHLLHAALRELLGEHVTQKGSLVDAERLRFDFSHGEAVTTAQLQAVETLVNAQIRSNHLVDVQHMAPEDAIAKGAMALFGEKYGDEVRVLQMGDFSIELCGGTHVKRTGDIGYFKIVSETGIAAGVRRIEALTGAAAIQWGIHNENILEDTASLLKASRTTMQTKLSQLVEKNRKLEKELQQARQKLATSSGKDLSAEAKQYGNLNVLATHIPGVDMNTLRSTLDQLKAKLEPAAIVLATVSDDKVQLVAGVSKAMTDTIQAGKLVNHVAQQVGGKGGGRPDMAQAGGTQPEYLDTALNSVYTWVEQQINE